MERLEIKAAFAVDDAGTITGIAWPFGSPDRVGDVVEKGAFSFPDRLPMLFMHDQAQVVGVWDSFDQSGEALNIKGRLLIDDVARAREVRAMIREGAVTGLSIGFISKKAKFRKGGARTFGAVDLHEISIVPIPSHPGARIISAKSAITEGGLMPHTETDAAPDFAALETRIKEVETKALASNDNSKLTERLDKIEAKMNRPAAKADNDNTDAALETKAFGSYLRHGDRTDALELKTLTVSGDPQGGYLAPAELSTEFIRDLVQFSPIRALATVRSTGAPSVSYPRRTGITNAKWKGEGATSEESEPAFGQVEIAVREVNTYVDISNQLLADSAGVAQSEVQLALSEDFGAKEGLAFVSGVGPLSPEGIMTNVDVGFTKSGNASTLGTNPADLLIDHMYSLPAAYRGRGTWLMNSKTLAAIRKLKDGTTGVYLWQPAYAAGQPETILGRPVIEIPDMADVGAGTEPILFGDIATAYRVIDRLALSILVNPYTLATNGLTRIHATRRVGAAVVQPNAIKKVRCAA